MRAHVTPLGILMIIHGVLILFPAAIMLGTYLILQTEFGEQPELIPHQQSSGILIFYGSCLLLTGLLTIISGITLLNRKGRITAVVILSAGMLTSITCYCAPTSIALAIYGYIVLLNSHVSLLFRNDGNT